MNKIIEDSLTSIARSLQSIDEKLELLVKDSIKRTNESKRKQLISKILNESKQNKNIIKSPIKMIDKIMSEEIFK